MPGREPSVDLSSRTVDAIRRHLSHDLASAGVRKSDIVVRPGEDHDGEPAIMVEVKYRRSPKPFDGQAAARAVFSLNSMLHRQGEYRFAYIAHNDEAGA